MFDSLFRSPYKIPGIHDPDSIRTLSIVVRPPSRTDSTVYYEGDIVIPTDFTGVYYEVKNPGKSASAEPTMETEIDAETVDGSVIWVTKRYNMLQAGVNITSATCTPTDGVTVSSVTNTDTEVSFTIDEIPALAAARFKLSFEVCAHIVLSNGDAVDRTYVFRVGEN